MHKPGTVWQPLILNPNSRDDHQRLLSLKGQEGMLECDHLETQLEGLATVRAPKAQLDKNPGALAREVAILRDSTVYANRRWVYFPWRRQLVHVLGPDEYAELRSNRNLYKLAPEEQQDLRTKTVGIVGLSVGRSSAATMALEGLAGRYKLADLDHLELSNLNRLRCSVADLGLNKAVLAARELYEIDPYLDIEVFDEGITADNIEAFLGGDHPLDLLVEECDALPMKVRLRERSKALRIPVLMETSDRGMVDIERFDLEPNRPLLHGLIQGVEASSLEGLSDKGRIPFALRVLGVDEMSVELAASLVEVGETITGWPQLASAVAVGGGLVSDLARKILLGKHRASGRFYVDLDDLFQPDRAAISLVDAPSASPPPPPEEPPVARTTRGEGAVSEPEVRALVAAAVRAPSGGNNQGWKFSFDGATLLCRVDPARVQTFLEFDRTGSSVSLGAAVENLAVAASAAGIAIEEEMVSTSSDPDLLCSVRFRRDASRAEDPLARWIEHRRTSRARGNGERLRPEHASALGRSVATSDATLQLLANDEEIEEIADIMGNNDRLAFQHEEVHAELMGDIRWTQDELHRRRDGLDLQTFDMKPHELSALGVLARWPVMERLREGNLGMGLESATRRAVQASAAVGLLSVPGCSSHAYFAGGRAMQRMWLEVTRLGIAMQPMTVLPALLTRLRRGQAQGFSQWHRAQLSALAERYERLYQRPADHADIMLFRLAYAPLETRPSLRRDLSDVYEYTGS